MDLLTFLGTEQGRWVLFWGGVGGVIVTILSGLGLYWWHNRCHIHHCVLIAHHPLGAIKVCRGHHPGLPKRITMEHAREIHRRGHL